MAGDLPELPRLPSIPQLPDFAGTSKSLPDFGSSATTKVAEPQPEPYVKPPKPVEAPKEAEPFGFITNLPKSTLNMAKGVFIDLPTQIAKSIYNIAKDPEQYGKDFNLMLQKNSGVGSMLWHELSDYYTKDLWHNFNEDPARGLTDLAALVSGVGMVGKAAGFGRAAVIADRAAAMGKLGLLSEEAQSAAKVGRVFQGLENAGHYIDPISGSFKLAGKALATPLAAIGIGENTQDLERISRHVAGREGLAAAQETQRQLFTGLNPDEHGRLERLLMLGVPEEIDNEALRGGKVWDRYERWHNRVNDFEQPYWKNQKLLGDDAMIEANAKAVELYTSRDGQIGIPRHVAEEMIREGTLKPTYLSMYRIKNQSLDLLDALDSLESSGKTLGRLEKRLGNGEYLTDLDEIMARQIHSFHQAKYKLSLLDEAKQMLLEKGKVLLARTPEEAESAIRQGYRRLDDEFYRKYWSSYNRATQMQVEALTEAARTGKNTVEALANASEKFNQIDSLERGAKMLLDRADIYVPRDAAAWLNRELAPPSGFWKTYDKFMSRFKSVNTVFNPRFWPSVIFGNALLGTMYGLSPDMIRIAMKYKGDLPPALKQIAKHEIFLRDLGIYDRVSTRLGEAASRLDNFYKNAIFTSEVAKDSYARTKFAMSNFYTAQDDIIKAVQYFGQSPERLSQARLGVAQAQREMAEAVALRDKALQRLKRAENASVKTIERLLGERQQSYVELATAMDQRADLLGKTLGDVTTLNPKYKYFADSYVDQIKKLRSAIKNQLPYADYIDKSRVIASMDAAAHSVASGHPERLKYALADLKKASNGSSSFAQNQRRLTVFLDQVGAAEEAVKQHTATLMSQAARSGELGKRIPLLAREAHVADHAIDIGNRFYGSYNSLLPFEKQIIRRIVPFYTFTKAMTQLAFQFPYLYPKRTFIITHLARAWNDVMHDDNAFLPSWAKQYIPVAATKDGGVVMVRLGSFTPMANVRMGQVGQHDIPTIMDLAGQHPVIRVLYDLKGGIPEWSKKPLSPGESAVRLDNGEVVKWTGTGFQTEIAQPSIWKTIFGMFPQSQLIHSVLSPYAQTDRGWLFHPDPVRDASGKPRYPKELSDILLSFVVPTTTVKLDELKKMEQVRVATTVKEFQREIRTAPPEQRESLIAALRAWALSRKAAVER